MTDHVGLDVALELNPDEAPILLCSFSPEGYFVKKEEFSTKFFALMAKKRTGFIDTISSYEDFYEKCLELIKSEKEEDLLALELNRIKEYEKAMGLIQHSVSGRIFGFADPNALVYINKARKVGVTGNDEEVFQKILYFQRDSKDAKFVGKYFPGIFCDLEGTLLLGDELNSKLLEKLKKLSLTKPITLWTAGDTEEYQKKLISKGILWKLVSKNDFFGAEVEIVYDDLSFEDFYSKFKIRVREFNQINGNHDDDLGLKLEFLHSLLIPSGALEVLSSPKFASILNMTIGQKEVREMVKEMESEEDIEQYHHSLVILRDFLVN